MGGGEGVPRERESRRHQTRGGRASSTTARATARLRLRGSLTTPHAQYPSTGCLSPELFRVRVGFRVRGRELLQPSEVRWHGLYARVTDPVAAEVQLTTLVKLVRVELRGDIPLFSEWPIVRGKDRRLLPAQRCKSSARAEMAPREPRCACSHARQVPEFAGTRGSSTGRLKSNHLIILIGSSGKLILQRLRGGMPSGRDIFAHSWVTKQAR